MRPLGTDYLQYDSEIYPFRTIIEEYIGEELESCLLYTSDAADE